MSADLRERLMEIVNKHDYEYDGVRSIDPEHIAIAAYRMALDDAARRCEDERDSYAIGSEERHIAFHCAAAVRALAEGL